MTAAFDSHDHDYTQPSTDPKPIGVQTFATGAVRGSDLAAVRYDLISPIAERRLAETYAEGSKKYSDYNWLKGLPAHDLINHAKAHINMFLTGDKSEDHLAHAVWNLCSLMHFQETRPDMLEGLPPPLVSQSVTGMINGMADAYKKASAESQYVPPFKFDIRVPDEKMAKVMEDTAKAEVIKAKFLYWNEDQHEWVCGLPPGTVLGQAMHSWGRDAKPVPVQVKPENIVSAISTENDGNNEDNDIIDDPTELSDPYPASVNTPYQFGANDDHFGINDTLHYMGGSIPDGYYELTGVSHSDHIFDNDIRRIRNGKVHSNGPEGRGLDLDKPIYHGVWFRLVGYLSESDKKGS